MLLRFLICFSFLFCCTYAKEPNKLLVVSFDGFRYDYLDRGITPNFRSILPESTRAKVLLNIFPTQTYPNHFSLATGLYAENHGVLASKTWDAETKKLMGYGYELFHYNDKVEPIWIHNERTPGHYSGVMMWPGSQFAYNGRNVTHETTYDKNKPFYDRVEEGISWFKHSKKPANLVLMYFEEPDAHSHAYGPNSPQVNAKIQAVDRVVKKIVDTLKKNNLDDVNVVFLSDHGMEGVTKDKVIDLTQWADSKTTHMYGTSPVLQVYPANGSEDNVFNILNEKSKELKNFKVFKREDIPERFHYKKCKRSPPILALAEPGYAFQDFIGSLEWQMKNFPGVYENSTLGVHGYDPDTITMHPYFIGKGPIFKKNFVTDHLYTVDMFLLFARILELPAPKMKLDGDPTRIENVFATTNPNKSNSQLLKAIPGLIFGLVVFILAMIATLVYVRCRNSSSNINTSSYIKVDLEDDDVL